MTPSERSYSYTRPWACAYFQVDAVEVRGRELTRYRYCDRVFYAAPADCPLADFVACAQAAAAAAGDRAMLAPLSEADAEVLRTHGWLVFECWQGPDYVYRTQDLAELKGSKYQAKRNHIHKFEALGAWRYGPLVADDARAVLDAWLAAKTAAGEADAESRLETTAIRRQLAEGWTCGGVLYLDDAPVAFAMGERLDDETMLVAYEKALDVPGAYALVNREFARREGAGYAYLNRASADGHPNLVKAKESYHPCLRLRKFRALASRCTWASAADADELAALWHDVFGDPVAAARFFFERRPGVTLVLREGGRIVAMGSVLDLGDARYLYALATRSDCRGRGLATEIVETAKRLSFAPLAVVPGEPGLVRFYEKLGFAESAPAVRREVMLDGFARDFYARCGLGPDEKVFCDLPTLAFPKGTAYEVAVPLN